MELKADPKLPHHYIIGVGVHSPTSKNPGQIYMKYKPVYFHHTDIEKIQYASILVKDKLFKTTSEEALKLAGQMELVLTISSLKIASHANQCTLHHFSCEVEVEEEHFENIVNLSNKYEKYKKLLRDSAIKGV